MNTNNYLVKKNDWFVSLALSIFSIILLTIFYLGLKTNNIVLLSVNDDFFNIIAGSLMVLFLLGILSISIVLWAIIIVVEDLFSKWLLYVVLLGLLLVTLAFKFIFNISLFEYLIYLNVLIPTIFFLPGIYLICKIAINKRKIATNKLMM